MSRLSHASYVVLALIEQGEPATPYDLKQRAELTVAEFWSFPHSRLYSEAARLADAGHLSEEREETGRRRRLYSLTPEGRNALADWRSEPTAELGELREPALIKLFFGVDPALLAGLQLAAHRRQLATYEEQRAACPPDAPAGVVLVLEAGIGHEREWVRFWEGLADSDRGR